MDNIQFIDLKAQQKFLGSKIEDAIKRVLEHGKYIMGPEVKQFEKQFADFGNTKRAIGCANGTDALLLPLMAWGIGKGDAVFCPSFTFAATAEMIAITGATPIFIDVLPDTYNIDVAQLETAIKEIKRQGELNAKLVISVDIFGQIADYPALRQICNKYDLRLFSDAAQGFASSMNGKQAGDFADIVSTSFFPAKPLGCYGDGGALLTNDDELANIIESLRVHGKGADKYDNVRIGVNSRLDTIQAAILIEKLNIFAKEIEKRNQIATRYSKELADFVTIPFVPEGVISTWAQYTIQFDKRDELQEKLKQNNVPSVVYYAKPLHQQTAYKDYPIAGNGLPITDKLAKTVLSLPMHPYMDNKTQDYIIKSVKNAVQAIA